MTNNKEYRIYGRYGMWGEIHDELEQAQRDLDFCNEQYADQIAAGKEMFVIQAREVTPWKDV